MKTIDEWLTLYGRDHQNPVNKLIHWICVPVILFTVFGLLMAIPFPEIANGWVESQVYTAFDAAAVVQKQRDYFATGKTKDVEFRIQQLKKLRQLSS
jgi:uncharacterized membrane protein YGL010W